MFKRLFKHWALPSKLWNRGDHAELMHYLQEVQENMTSARQCMYRAYGPDSTVVKAADNLLKGIGTMLVANKLQMDRIQQIDLAALEVTRKTGRKVVDVELPAEGTGI